MLLPDQFEPHGILHSLHRQAPLFPPLSPLNSFSIKHSNYLLPTLHWAGGVPGRGAPQAYHRVRGVWVGTSGIDVKPHS